MVVWSQGLFLSFHNTHISRLCPCQCELLSTSAVHKHPSSRSRALWKNAWFYISGKKQTGEATCAQKQRLQGSLWKDTGVNLNGVPLAEDVAIWALERWLQWAGTHQIYKNPPVHYNTWWNWPVFFQGCQAPTHGENWWGESQVFIQIFLLGVHLRKPL